MASRRALIKSGQKKKKVMCIKCVRRSAKGAFPSSTFSENTNSACLLRYEEGIFLSQVLIGAAAQRVARFQQQRIYCSLTNQALGCLDWKIKFRAKGYNAIRFSVGLNAQTQNRMLTFYGTAHFLRQFVNCSTNLSPTSM